MTKIVLIAVSAGAFALTAPSAHAQTGGNKNKSGGSEQSKLEKCCAQLSMHWDGKSCDLRGKGTGVRYQICLDD